jgi:hypothetical protein
MALFKRIDRDNDFKISPTDLSFIFIHDLQTLLRDGRNSFI